jgi:predicted RNA polymerase sigma factor
MAVIPQANKTDPDQPAIWLLSHGQTRQIQISRQYGCYPMGEQDRSRSGSAGNMAVIPRVNKTDPDPDQPAIWLLSHGRTRQIQIRWHTVHFVISLILTKKQPV